MPAVPELLLRKLFIRGSLVSRADGFSFQLNDTLLAVTLTEIQIEADNTILPVKNLSLQLSGQGIIAAEEISDQVPLALPLNVPLTVLAICENPKPGKLTIEASTREIGLLRFSIDLKEKKPFPIVTGIKEVQKQTSNVVRAIKAASDPHHPIYHFTPPANWMNDPNGLVQWEGKTHLFYQYNPFAPVWGSICWGHAESRDLVHWKRLPIAMRPQEGTANADGCWSGSAIVTADGPVFFYTGVFPETVCLARPDERFRNLINDPGNPVIQVPPGMELEGFRDPCVWQEGDCWYLTIGSGFKDRGGAVLLYRSGDMRHWEYMHPLLEGDAHKTKPMATGTMWECPQLVRIEDQYFLFISAILDAQTQSTLYFQGSMQDHHFIPSSIHRVEPDSTLYAPLSFEDNRRRRIFYGWIKEERTEKACRKAGWAGTLSLPRLLSLSKSKELRVDPAPEVERLRKDMISEFTGELTETPLLISGSQPIRNIEADIVVTADEGSAVQFILAESPQAQERTTISYDSRQQELVVDTLASSLDPLAEGRRKSSPLPLQPGEALELRLFLDGSVLEVYANHRVVITSRLYPTSTNHLRFFACAPRREGDLASGRLYRLGSCQR